MLVPKLPFGNEPELAGGKAGSPILVVCGGTKLYQARNIEPVPLSGVFSIRGRFVPIYPNGSTVAVRKRLLDGMVSYMQQIGREERDGQRFRLRLFSGAH